MKMKKQLTLFCAALLTIGSVCGCGTEKAPEDTTQQDAVLNKETAAPDVLAEITAIDGTTVTLRRLGGGQGMENFEMEENPSMADDGERPEPPETGEKPNENGGIQPPGMENKELPEGFSPPEMNPGENAAGSPFPPAEPVTVDLAAFDSIDISALAVGDFLSLTMDVDGNITAVEMAELPEMPANIPPASEEKPST